MLVLYNIHASIIVSLRKPFTLNINFAEPVLINLLTQKKASVILSAIYTLAPFEALEIQDSHYL